MIDFKIDFVVTWVDGEDTEWRKKKEKNSGKKINDINRYRDYGLLPNFFERIWKFAPWVNNVFLVTDNQAPRWAQEDDRITTVDHTDYIPKEYLPTFNSNVIEMNLGNLQQLEEHFVIFNDDIYLTGDVKPEDFFSPEGLPVLYGAQNPVSPHDDFSKVSFNNMVCVNKYYPKRAAIKKNFSKYFSTKYGLSGNLRSILSLPYNDWLGFYEDHLPMPNLKSWFVDLKTKEPEIFETTSSHKFRESTDNNVWLLKNLYIASGNFVPRSRKFGTVVNVEKMADIDNLESLIQNYKVIVLNDDFESNQDAIVDKMANIMKKGF